MIANSRFDHNRILTQRESGMVATRLTNGGFEVLEPLVPDMGKRSDSYMEIIEGLAGANDISDSYYIRVHIKNGRIAAIDGRWNETDDEFEMERSEVIALNWNERLIRTHLVLEFKEFYSED
jgi:DNA-binding response OmpR family regulator